jgi:hypothetical protein
MTTSCVVLWRRRLAGGFSGIHTAQNRRQDPDATNNMLSSEHQMKYTPRIGLSVRNAR